MKYRGRVRNGRTSSPRKRQPAATSKRTRPEKAVTRTASVPWGYGVDRIKAIAVDPERLFVYWEVTDETIAHSRGKFRAEGSSAVFVLRVYDTTGRIFDGTNAHGWFDHEVARGDRQWFFDIDKPTSEVIVELGLRSQDGDFARMARSKRVEFPRRGPATQGVPRWLTVRIHEARPQHSAGAEVGPPRSGPSTHVVDGPWELVIHGIGQHRKQAVSEHGQPQRKVPARVVPAKGPMMVGSSASLDFGKSERPRLAGNEEPLMGASDLRWFGASERRLGGSSEQTSGGDRERSPRNGGAYPRVCPETGAES